MCMIIYKIKLYSLSWHYTVTRHVSTNSSEIGFLLMQYYIVLQVIDLATLTGACIVALGPSIAGTVTLRASFALWPI